VWSISGKTCGLEDWGLDNIHLGRKALLLHFPYFSHQAATSNYSRVWLGDVLPGGVPQLFRAWFYQSPNFAGGLETLLNCNLG
jgi:hypothetical protein